MKRFGNMIIISLALTLPLLAQDVVQEEIQVKLVEIDVKVTNLMGKPVFGLTEEDFTIREDGRRQTIDSFEEIHIERMPEEEADFYRPRVMLLLDYQNTNRASMVRIFPELRRLVEEHHSANSEMGLAVNAGGIQLVQDFTRNPDHMIRALDIAEDLYKGTQGRWAFAQRDFISPNDAANLGEQEYLSMYYARQLYYLKLFVNYLGGYSGTKNVIMVSNSWLDRAEDTVDQNISLAVRGADPFGRNLEALEGSSNLEDAIAMAGALPRRINQGITDGYNINPEGMSALRDIQTACLLNKVSVNVVNAQRRGIDVQGRASVQANPSASLSQQEELAALTGGFLYRPNSKGIALMIDRVVDQNESFYRLRYYSQNKNQDFRRVTVRAKGLGRQVHTFGGYHGNAQKVVNREALLSAKQEGVDKIELNMDTDWMEWYPVTLTKNRAYFAISQRAYDEDGKLMMEKVTASTLSKKGRAKIQLKGTLFFESPPEGKEPARLEVMIIDMISGKRVVLKSEEDNSAA